MEKIAIIDMGSNSIRFLVLEIADNRSYTLLYQEKETIRLGVGLAQSGYISADGIKRALNSLKMYRHIMSVMGVNKCLAVATAAVRSAKNGREFLETIKQETHIHMEVITGEREAYLGYLGVINTIRERDFLLFDLGGASIEICLLYTSPSPRDLSTSRMPSSA